MHATTRSTSAFLIAALLIAGCEGRPPPAPSPKDADSVLVDAGILAPFDAGASARDAEVAPSDAGAEPMDATVMDGGSPLPDAGLVLGPEASTYLEGTLEALCERELSCQRFATVDGCRAELRPRTLLIALAIQRGTARYDQAQMDACRSALRAFGCPNDLFAHDAPFYAVVHDCRLGRGAVGLLGEGDLCVQDAECADFRCAKVDPSCHQACCESRCVANPRVVVDRGEPCVGRDTTCDDDSYCDGEVCTAKHLDAGAECERGDECAWPLVCSFLGTCERLGGQVETCHVVGCEDERHVCNGRCMRRRLPGAECTTENDCVRYAICIELTCVRMPEPGEPCAPDIGCRAGSCQAGICTVSPLRDCRE